MDESKNLKYYDALDDEGRFENTGGRRQGSKVQKNKKASLVVQQFVQKQDDKQASISFTYKAARFEEGWLLKTLGYFFEHQWISDVLSKVKVGKEASVYLCRSGEQVLAPLLAAKVYRPKMLRSLKNNQVYRQGRAVLDESGHEVVDLGMLKALHNRTMYGEQITLQSWIAYEMQTIKTLYEAGADVPQPFEMGENAILMGFIGDEASPAPTLNTVSLSPEEVKPLFDRCLGNIEIMLANDIVHADLSAYNILYHQGQITLIDFPQVVSASNHPGAWQIFSRDVRRVCEYFTRQGLQIDPAALAARLWKAHGLRIHAELHPALLDADDPVDRQLWQKSREAE
jgi:RIO kinase 1